MPRSRRPLPFPHARLSPLSTPPLPPPPIRPPTLPAFASPPLASPPLSTPNLRSLSSIVPAVDPDPAVHMPPHSSVSPILLSPVPTTAPHTVPLASRLRLLSSSNAAPAGWLADSTRRSSAHPLVPLPSFPSTALPLSHLLSALLSPQIARGCIVSPRLPPASGSTPAPPLAVL